MITETNPSHNGTGRGASLHCPSDYEARPVVDVVPRVPAPKWPDQLARFTWSLTWQDANDCSNSLTIRADDLPTLLEDLKLVKRGIVMAKAKAKGNAATGSPQEPVDAPAETGDVPVCKIHNVTMTRRVSKRTGGHYWAHNAGKEICFGKSREAKA